jgi:hypothetical protein
VRLRADVDQRGQGLDRLAFIDMGQKPDGSLIIDDTRRFSLPDDVFGDHVDKKLFPLGRIIHFGADDGKQLIPDSRETSRVANTSRFNQATSWAVTRRPRIIALMIVRLLSIAKAIIRTCTLSGPPTLSTGLDTGRPCAPMFSRK